ncbi:UDP-glucose 4-epimerase GalE [Actinacidiphila yeochonensis]|uniref:UDP-glucose 4-epimerase GalE n=1 Tax=Actinacidiphila yeochonensis TaxID=89050 RepID=UPI00056264D4|nr:UDP-glucose 4-epimerase GalE [Actinacidiphila yeochonensis]
MKVLITGGAGFIGSTVASACLDEGITPVILDNLSTGRREFTEGRAFYEGDIADGDLLDRVFADHPDIGAVIHCAALIVVPESVAEPLRYYRENVAKTVDLLEHLLRNGCEQVLFSSSAAIYAPEPGDVVVDETSEVAPSSPYARTKAMMEQILQDTAAASPLRVISLRYFNPIGADPALRTGLQNPAPSHALGKLTEAYAAKEPFVVTGVDWPTRDGSGIRDYIHVWDLAQAHVAALRRFPAILPAGGGAGYQVVNIGTGTGTTVRELVRAFEEVVGERLDVVEAAPRPGDVNGSYTANATAARLLGWKAARSVEDGIRDSLAWRVEWARRLAARDADGA